MKQVKVLNITRARRTARVHARARIAGNHPRLSVFRSNASMYVQVIDDAQGKTVASASLKEVKVPAQKTGVGVSKALALGKLIAEKAVKAGIKEVVFDRGGYAYHGRIKAIADGAREGGLKF